jgi:hypothetical protein
MTAPRFYAIRQTRRPRVIGSRSMTLADAEREVRVWAREIGPAVVVPATPETRAAVRREDQTEMAAILAAAQGEMTDDG